MMLISAAEGQSASLAFPFWHRGVGWKVTNGGAPVQVIR